MKISVYHLIGVAAFARPIHPNAQKRQKAHRRDDSIRLCLAHVGWLTRTARIFTYANPIIKSFVTSLLQASHSTSKNRPRLVAYLIANFVLTHNQIAGQLVQGICCLK
jgi:hypothetical protein